SPLPGPGWKPHIGRPSAPASPASPRPPPPPPVPPPPVSLPPLPAPSRGAALPPPHAPASASAATSQSCLVVLLRGPDPTDRAAFWVDFRAEVPRLLAVQTGTQRAACAGIAGAAVVAAALGASCAATTARGLETEVAKTLVSTDEENQIGLQLKNDLD